VFADKTGYVAKPKDCHDLAQGIMSILNLETDEHMKMRKNCSELGVKLLSPKVQANKILDVIGDRLDRNII
jgi:glycosyltransferase involved in cell wall biosynthesis